MKFEMPAVEVVKFAVEDVITVSGGTGNNDTPAPTETLPAFMGATCMS